jgi:hypothetical protein
VGEVVRQLMTLFLLLLLDLFVLDILVGLLMGVTINNTNQLSIKRQQQLG